MEESKGALSIFGTDFASKGFYWAGNLCQKWENICRENIAVQDPSKFVDAVSEQFRKICEEVADDWLNPFSDGCVKGPVSDLSLEQDVIAEICKKSKIEHDGSPINEGPLISISSEEDKSVAPLPAIEHAAREGSCEVLKKVTMAPAEVNRCSRTSKIREYREEVSPNFVNHPALLSSADGVLLSEFPENIAERAFKPSNCTIPTEENGTSASEEAISSVQSIANAYEQKSNSTEPGVPSPPMELADTNIEENEEFEDVNMEDLFEGNKQVNCWEHTEKYELAMIPHRAMKNWSYKKKLREVFSSNFYSPKKKSHNHGASFDGAIAVVPVERDVTTSSVSSRGLHSRDSSTTESSEPDWELL